MSEYARDTLEGVLDCMRQEVANPQPPDWPHSHRDEMDGLLLRLVPILRSDYSHALLTDQQRALVRAAERVYFVDRFPQLATDPVGYFVDGVQRREQWRRDHPE